MNKYLQTITSEIHDMIENCPCDSPTTTKLLNICEKINTAIQFIANQQGEKEEV